MKTVPAIYEILEAVEAETSPAQKKNKLREYANNQVLLTVLKHAFDPNIQFCVDEAKYKPCDGEPSMLYGRLYQESRRFYVFTNPDLNIRADKRRRLWLDLLESIAPEDAAIVASLPKKKLPYPSITAKVVKAAFPNLF